MVARSGLFVAPLAGTPPVGMSPTDGRIAFSSLIGTTPQSASGGVIAQSGATMAFTIASGVWQLPDVSNVAGTSNFLSAIDSTVLTAAAGPATGSRIDLICAKQNNVENSDADSRANLFLVAGTAGAPGVAPAVPIGAYLHATVNVPTTAANAAACTVVLARPTTFGTLSVKSPTAALLSTVPGSSTGQRAEVYADSTAANNMTYRWNGSAWKTWESDWITSYAPVFTSGSGSGVTMTSSTFKYKWVAGSMAYEWLGQVGAVGTSAGSLYLSLPITSSGPGSHYSSYCPSNAKTGRAYVGGGTSRIDIAAYDNSTFIVAGLYILASGSISI